MQESVKPGQNDSIRLKAGFSLANTSIERYFQIDKDLCLWGNWRMTGNAAMHIQAFPIVFSH